MAYADENLFLWVNQWVGALPAFDSLMVRVASDYLVPVGLALTLVGLWFLGDDRLTRQRHQIGVFVALAAMGLANLAVLIINVVYFRPRPFVDHEVAVILYRPTDLSSFPSNAVAATFAIAASVWGVNRRLGTVLFVAAAVYGLSRVYTGVHYPLDVVAGALIGIVISFLTFRLRDLLGPLPTWVIKVARILCLA